MEKITYHLSEIQTVAQRILPLLHHKIVLIKAQMGMGKTTLVKALVNSLGINDVVSSPTFNLVNEYTNGIDTVFHFDFYRLKNEEEALGFGIEEYIYSGNWCFMEWSEKIESLLPDDVSQVHIASGGEQVRTLTILNEKRLKKRVVFQKV